MSERKFRMLELGITVGLTLLGWAVVCAVGWGKLQAQQDRFVMRGEAYEKFVSRNELATIQGQLNRIEEKLDRHMETPNNKTR